MKEIKIGDYVIATKYRDGNPQDHWAVGFYAGVTAPHYDPPRYDVVDTEGKNFRGNGFRRIKTISARRGRWILARTQGAERADYYRRSIWGYVREKMSDKTPEAP